MAMTRKMTRTTTAPVSERLHRRLLHRWGPAAVLVLGPGLGLGLGSGCTTPELEPATTKNVLIIYIDTLRQDHIGAYGYTPPTSPNIDALAQKGARFANSYAPTPWTYSSTASLFTGLYPGGHGAVIPGEYRNEATKAAAVVQLADDVQTLADVTEKAGVRTALIARNTYLGYGLEKGWGTYDNQKGRTAKEQTDLSLEWLDSLGDDERFVLVTHYMDVHTPNKNRKEDRAHFPAVQGMDKDARNFFRRWQRRYSDGNPSVVPGFEEYRARRTALYDSSIRYIDSQVGRLLEGLGDRGRDTLVIVTADHGEEFWEHAAIEKRYYKDPRNLYGTGHGHTFFEENIRVPLIVYQPGVVAPRVIDERASLIDILPTITEFMDIPDSAPREGRSLVPALNGEASPERSLIFDSVAFGADKQAILSGDLKYIRSVHETSLLFDLSVDPAEQYDVSVAHPEDVAKLEAELDRALSRSKAIDAAIRGQTDARLHEFSSDELDALKALGYVWEPEDGAAPEAPSGTPAVVPAPAPAPEQSSPPDPR
jgi:arylsulfatase A-like enzyme